MREDGLVEGARKLIHRETGRDRQSVVVALRSLLPSEASQGESPTIQVMQLVLSYLSGDKPLLLLSDILTEWDTVAPSLRGALDSDFLGDVLRVATVGASGTVNWDNWLLEHREVAVVDELVSGKLLKTSTMLSFVKQNPQAAFGHRVLDVLIEAGRAVPREVWAAGLNGELRPPGLLRLSTAIASALSNETDLSAARWLVAMASTHEGLSAEVLTALFRSPVRTAEIATALATAGLSRTGGARKKEQEEFDRALPVFLIAIQGAHEADGVQASAARLLLAILLAVSSEVPKAFSENAHRQLRRTAGLLHVGRLSEGLLSMETAKSQKQDQSVFPVTAATAYEAVHKYFEALGLGQNRGSGDRATEIAMWRGKREVIEPLLDLVSLPSDGSTSVESVRDVLFNAGVRAFADLGEIASFRPTHHQLEEGAALEGDRVLVLAPGWVLGDGQDAVVLRKATVTSETA